MSLSGHDPNARAQYNTHLHAAIANGDLDWAEMALHFGADPNCPDEEGNAPLHLVFSLTEELTNSFLDLLLAAGANIQTPNKDGQTAQSLAEIHDRWDIALKLAAHQI